LRTSVNPGGDIRRRTAQRGHQFRGQRAYLDKLTKYADDLLKN